MSIIKFKIGVIIESKQITPLTWVHDRMEVCSPGTEWNVDVVPFLYKVQGFFFGILYIPYIYCNSIKYFVELINNMYTLTQIPNGNCIAFQLIQPEINWNNVLSNNEIDWKNMIWNGDTVFIKETQSQDRLSYSPTQCNENCGICGNCPVGLTCNNGACMSMFQVNSTNFGMRYMCDEQMYVMTYVMYEDYVELRYVKDIDIAGYNEKAPLKYPEKWFFIENATPINKNTKCLIYIYINTKKYYLENVSDILCDDNGSYVNYKLVSSQNDKNVLVFNPIHCGKWGDYVFTSEDFQNLCIPVNSLVAMWGNVSSDKKQFVNQGTIKPPPPLPIIPIVSSIPKPLSIWTNYWFWGLMIFLFLVLLVLGIILYYRKISVIEDCACPSGYEYIQPICPTNIPPCP